MKILFVSWSYSVHVIRYIEWLIQRNQDIYLLIPEKNYEYIHENSIKIIKISFCKEDFKYNYDLVKKTIESIQPDFIHLMTGLYPVYFAAFVSNIPFCVNFINGDLMWNHNNSISKKILTYELLNRSNINILNSEVMKQVADIKCSNNPKKNKLIYLNPGYEELIKKYNKEELRKYFNLPKNKKIILSPRGWARYSNLESIIDAINNLSSDYYFVFLESIPHNFYYYKILKKFQSINKNNYKLINRKLNLKEMSYIYQISDLIISLSSCDSIPTTFIESIISQKPCLLGNTNATNYLYDKKLKKYLLIDMNKLMNLTSYIKKIFLNYDFIIQNILILKKKWRQEFENDKNLIDLENIYNDMKDQNNILDYDMNYLKVLYELNENIGNRFDKINALEKVIEKDINNVFAKMLIVDIYLYTDELKKAEDILDASEELMKKYPEYFSLKGILKIKQKKLDEAHYCFKKSYLMNGYDNIIAYDFLEYLNTINKKYKKIHSDKITQYGFYQRFDLLLLKIKFDEKFVLDDLIKTNTFCDSEDKDVLIIDLCIFLIQNNYYKVAKDLYIKYLFDSMEIKLENILDIGIRLNKLYNLASYFKNNEDYNLSVNIFILLFYKTNDINIKYFEKFISGICFHLGEGYLLLNDNKNSMKYLKICLQKNPNHKKADMLLKNIY